MKVLVNLIHFFAEISPTFSYHHSWKFLECDTGFAACFPTPQGPLPHITKRRTMKTMEHDPELDGKLRGWPVRIFDLS